MKWFERCNPFTVLLYFVSVPVLAAIYNNPYHTAVTLAAGIIYFVMMRGKKKAAFWFFTVFILTYRDRPIPRGETKCFN